jgi:F0F1-type ATP synthase delta subunit
MAKLPRHHIAAVLAKQTLGRINTGEFSARVAAYLLSEGRTAELEPLLRDIMQYRANHGIVEVVAVTAFELNDSVRSDIEKQVKSVFPDAKTIIISQEIQPDVVGGLRLELPNQQLDVSVRAKLSRFKQLTQATR